MMITDNDDKMTSFNYTKASESETKAKNLKIILVETKQHHIDQNFFGCFWASQLVRLLRR